MYYITNQNNQIIALDPSLLALLEVENIDELYREIALGNIKFSLSKEDKEVTIAIAQNEQIYNIEDNDLSSVLGTITLIRILASDKNDDISTFTLIGKDEELSITEDEKALSKDILNLDINVEEELFLPEEDLIPIKVTDELAEKDQELPIAEDENTLDQELLLSEEDLIPIKVTDELPEKDQELPIAEDEELLLPEEDLIPIKVTDDLAENNAELFNPVMTDTLEKISSESSTAEKDDNEFFDLILPKAAENAIDQIDTSTAKTLAITDNDQVPIVIDIANISQRIGISPEDYNTFLNEYIDTALSLEKDLQDTEKEKRSNAIRTLSNLANVLHLPVISTSIEDIENSTAENQNSTIEAFYTMLGRLTTSIPEASEEENLSISAMDSEIKSDVADLIDIHKEEPVSDRETESTATNKSFGTINLDNVKPIHFDFQLEEAAKDLSLPVELIEEFVHDFIEQAHLETKKMLEAYEKGDLETIQKIGHLLKGTSSNLRINPLSDTLYEIQFCEDSSKLENMIKQYWGHFLSLENQINLISK